MVSVTASASTGRSPASGRLVGARTADADADAGQGESSPNAIRRRVRGIRNELLRWPVVLPLRRQIGAAAFAVVVLGVLAIVLDANTTSPTLVFVLFLFAVVAIATAGGRVVAIATAIAAHTLANRTLPGRANPFELTNGERMLELAVFVAVAVTIATLVETATRRRNVLRSRTEEAARLTAANELRTALLRAVSHDLRTPLATAKLATSSLMAGSHNLDDSARTELVTIADQQLDRLERIIGNLLDAGRLEAGIISPQLEDVDIIEVVGRLLTTIPDENVRRVGFRLDPNATMMRADAALTERVLTNLVSNALGADPTGAIVIATRRIGADVAVDVIDRGPGMSPERRATAFQPFHRFEDHGAPTGIGLGLAICAGFSDAMGATLSLDETRGGGLTATLRAPAPTTDGDPVRSEATERASMVAR